MDSAPIVHVLCLHTGGQARLTATGTLGVRGGPLIRWMAGSPALAMGPELEQALEGLGTGRLQDGRDVGAWWLALEGAAPSGRSGDLAIAVAVLLRWCQDELAVARTSDGESPRSGLPHATVVLTGSGRFALSEEGVGVPVLAPVDGWPAKLRHLAAAPLAQVASKILVFCPAVQEAEVEAAARGVFATPTGPLQTPAGAPISLVPLREPAELVYALRAQLGRGASPAPWSISGAAPTATALLHAAEAQARQDGLGYLGVEHVLRAFLAGGGPAAERLKRALSERDLFPALPRPSEAPRALVPTPRLRKIAAGLSHGFQAEDLVRAVVNDRHCPLHSLAGIDLSLLMPAREDGDATLPNFSWDSPSAPPKATGLEVQRGPEDGRVLTPRVGDTIGRWANEDAASLTLFQDSAARDRLLSRRHLAWEGDGNVRALRPTKRLRDHSALPIGADQRVEILEGDVLVISPATWLRGVVATKIE